MNQSIGLPVNGFFLPMKQQSNIAIIVSGGSGTRLGSAVPKQYIEVNGKTILQYCIENFLNHTRITHIVVVVHTDYIDTVAQLIAHYNSKPVVLATGGEHRYHSVFAGLQRAAQIDAEANVLIHDAVRASTGEQIISNVVDALANYEAACPVTPVPDSLIQLNDGRTPQHMNRNSIKIVQTPQGFRLPSILFAYHEFLKEQSFIPTDDSSLYLRYAFHPDIVLTEGHTDNFKITYPSDILKFKVLIEASR